MGLRCSRRLWRIRADNVPGRRVLRHQVCRLIAERTFRELEDTARAHRPVNRTDLGTVDGQTAPISELCERFGLNKRRIWRLIHRRKMTPKEAFVYARQ
jgi:hypothetical protein